MNKRPVSIHDLYDAHTLLIMRVVLRAQSCCIDVGAHTGSILSEMVRLSPRGKHFAFELIPELYQALKGTFSQVSVYDYACSDAEGDSSFFHVKNNPAYSGLKMRRYDQPDPVVTEIKVRKCLLDGVIPRDQKIDFIKIDVEGGELGVLRGAKRIIKEHMPFIVFESGKGASDYYGTDGEKLYDYLAGECGMEINTLDGFLCGSAPLTRQLLADEFNSVAHYYFIAGRPAADAERAARARTYLLDIDMRLFALERRFAQPQDGGAAFEVQDWGPRNMVLGDIPNRQANGGLGLWLRVNGPCSAGEICLSCGGTDVAVYCSPGLVTAEIPAALLGKVGGYELKLRHVLTDKVTPIGTLVVNRSSMVF